MRSHVQFFVTLLMAALLTACASTSPSPAQPTPTESPITPGKVTLTDVRGRPNPLAGGTSAVYLTILNGLDHDVRLVRVSSPVAAVGETHETVNDNGVMRMIPRPDGFLIPAQQSLKLEPGGKHIMLMNLAAPLATGDEFPLGLQLDTGEVMSVTVPVMETVPGMTMDTQESADSHPLADDHSQDAEKHDEHTESATHEHPTQEHEHGAGDSEHTRSGFPPEIQEAVAALPIYEIHGLDDSLMAGVLDPNAIALVDELLAGLEAVAWPEELHELVAGLTTLGLELRAALQAGDLTTAAELVRQIHDQAHELEFQVQQ